MRSENTPNHGYQEVSIGSPHQWMVTPSGESITIAVAAERLDALEAEVETLRENLDKVVRALELAGYRPDEYGGTDTAWGDIGKMHTELTTLRTDARTLAKGIKRFAHRPQNVALEEVAAMRRILDEPEPADSESHGLKSDGEGSTVKVEFTCDECGCHTFQSLEIICDGCGVGGQFEHVNHSTSTA